MNKLKQTMIAGKNWFIKASLKKKLLILAVVIAIIWFARPLVLGEPSKKPQYQTAQAERGTLVQSVTASGTVTSGNSSSINTQATGVIKEIYVKNGDMVTAGQAIALLTPDQNGTQNQAESYANYLSAVNSEKTAEQNKLSTDATMWQSQQAVLDAQNSVNYKNGNTTNPSTNANYTDLEKSSIDSGLVQSQKAFSANEKKYQEADAAVAAANAQMTSSWLSYQQTSPTIVAPIDGKVDGLAIQVGTVISGSSSNSTSSNTSSSDTSSSSNSSNSSSSQTIGTIKTDGQPSIKVNLSEIDAPTVKIGDRATVTFDAFAGKTFTGKVVSIDTSGSVSSGVTTYPATIALDSPPTVLYSNMSVSASIITNSKDDVVMVPTAAIQTQDDQSTVRVMKNGKVQAVPVETGISNDTEIEITSGINEGDTVVTGQITSTMSTSGQSTSPFGGGLGGRGFGGGGATFIRR